MIPIELTEQQEDKLLQMAKFFYPECDKLCIVHSQIDVQDVVIMVALFKTNPEFEKTLLGYPNEGEYIYWFEFCSTALLAKFIAINGDYSILPQYSKHTYQYYINECTNSAVYDSRALHPIDFLYEIFKK